MRIVYIHQYFRKPEQGGALRSYYLAKALVDAGHEVELITAHNGHEYYFENIDGIRVHYLSIAYDNTFSAGERMVAFVKFFLKSLWFALKLKNIDICYATSTPLTVGLTAILLKKLKRVPYYFEVRDLWPEAPIQLGYIRSKWLQKILYKAERSIYRQAKKVITLSPGMEAGVQLHKPAWALEMIPNMADCDYYQLTPVTRTHFVEPFCICYIGAIGKANHLDFLLAAARACHEEGLVQVKFIVAGAGSELKRLKAQANFQGIKNISWTGHLTREQVRHYLSTAHATYTSFNTQPVLQTNSPNKFFDSLAAGKLTIVNTQGWLRELVEQHKCGFYADPTKPLEFVQKLRPYLEHPDLLEHAQQHARELAENRYSREILTKQFVKLF